MRKDNQTQIQDIVQLLNNMKDFDFDLHIIFCDDTEFGLLSKYFIEAKVITLGKNKNKTVNLLIKYNQNAFVIDTIEFPINYVDDIVLKLHFTDTEEFENE